MWKKLSKYPVSEKVKQSRKLIKYWNTRLYHEDDMLDQEYLKTLNPNNENNLQTHQNIRTNI